MKSCISYNDHKNIFHNIMQSRPFPTMNIVKKVDPHKTQILVMDRYVSKFNFCLVVKKLDFKIKYFYNVFKIGDVHPNKKLNDLET